MTFASTPLLRTALHLLLALSVALQAGAVVAMHAGPGAAAQHASTVDADAAAMPAPGTRDTTRVGAMPPCHAALADAHGTPANAAAPTDACCGDSALGELCRWACAQAMSAVVPALAVAARPVSAPHLTPLALPAASWHHAAPLRPPIG